MPPRTTPPPPPPPSDIPADEAEVLEGHSYHGEAFNEGPRQAAYLMPNPGNVHFPVSTENADVQAMFNQGVGQLHGFWFFEAERSFRQVAAIEPELASAYWGMAMANYDNPERAADFAHEAWVRREGASEREQMYIDALARYYGEDKERPEESEQPEEPEGDGEGEEGPGEYGAGEEDDGQAEEAAEEPEEEEEVEEVDDDQRRRNYIKDLEKLIRAYPEDIEAKAFLVNQMWVDSYRGGGEIVSRQANQALLDEVFAQVPNHPAHHYRIHLWDHEDTSEYAVSSAVASGPSWPGIAHMWHMGGHIFENLGRHDDAAWQQEASARIDHGHMMRDYVLPDQIHNFAHNNEWLVRSLGHVGRVREAIDLAKNMIELPRHPKWNDLDQGGTSSWWGRRRLLATLERYELWEELIETCGSYYLEPSEEASEEAYRAYLLGLASTFLGHEDQRVAQIAELERLLAVVKVERAEEMDAAEQEALDEGLERREVTEAMTEVLKEHRGDVDGILRNLAKLEALDQVLKGEGGRGRPRDPGGQALRAPDPRPLPGRGGSHRRGPRAGPGRGRRGQGSGPAPGGPGPHPGAGGGP